MTIAPEIFKAYDIRGIVDKSLTEDAVRDIGRGLGTLALRKGRDAIIIGRDGRLSGPRLAKALADGIRSTGCHVIDIGLVATPLTYFAAHELGTHSAVMVTGSHNPPEYNGLKMVVDGETLSSDAIQALRRQIEARDFLTGAGEYSEKKVDAAYLDRIVGDVKLSRPMKIVLDCGNGAASPFAPELFKRLGCEIVPLFCEVDGNFPNHHPDPSKPENLQDVIRALKETDAELGLAFDGDGDRLGVVTKDGQIIFPDRQLMLFAADVLSRNPDAEILFDVKSTRNLFAWIRKHGGKPLLWKTGHSLIKAKLKETGAPLAGEMSGHVFFKERWYGFDDGMYAGARLLEILSRFADPSATLNALPNSMCTPELNLKMAEGEHHALIARLQGAAKFPTSTECITLDGLRVEYPDGFGLMRASNTTPVVVLRFEAENDAAMARIQAEFRGILGAALPGMELPF
jgi:phosphomannomutase / phosphoglucomutase